MGGEVSAAELANSFARDAGVSDDGGGHDFAACSGRFAIDLRLSYALDLKDDLLDLARVDLLAGRVDQITGPAGEDHLAILPDFGQVVSDEAARWERLKRCRIDEIAEGHVGAGDGEAAGIERRPCPAPPPRRRGRR